MANALSPKQRKFCDLFLDGMPAGRAYEFAGYKARGDDADCCAAKLQGNAKVKDYITSMNEKTESSTVMSVLERKEMLTRIAKRTEDECPQDAIRASAELSKMDGGYEPEKHEIEFIVNIGGDAE